MIRLPKRFREANPNILYCAVTALVWTALALPLSARADAPLGPGVLGGDRTIVAWVYFADRPAAKVGAAGGVALETARPALS
ncbi:MAG TPA: hypothetical protein VJY35_11890, partial [Candidatus Eisenbacteria bacterium]|nr:hypothetical protein [Candidatus Eisenbacteria bacterium]